MSYKHSVEKLNPRHYKILDYCIAGLTNRQIADKLGMGRIQVGIVVASPSFQHQFALRRQQEEKTQSEFEATKIDEVKEVLQKNAKDAADKLIGGMTSQDEKIVLKSATEILDRTGYPKEQKVIGGPVGAQILINSADMVLLKESLELDKEEKADVTTGSGA